MKNETVSKMFCEKTLGNICQLNLIWMLSGFSFFMIIIFNSKNTLIIQLNSENLDNAQLSKLEVMQNQKMESCKYSANSDMNK